MYIYIIFIIYIYNYIYIYESKCLFITNYVLWPVLEMVNILGFRWTRITQYWRNMWVSHQDRKVNHHYFIRIRCFSILCEYIYIYIYLSLYIYINTYTHIIYTVSQREKGLNEAVFVQKCPDLPLVLARSQHRKKTASQWWHENSSTRHQCLSTRKWLVLQWRYH